MERVHQHDLIVCEGDDIDSNCPACRRSVAGQISFWCNLCESYFHEGCAKLAVEIKLFFHPFPLLLTYINMSHMCRSCFDYCCYRFFYQCGGCEFGICVECVLRDLSVATLHGESGKDHILHCCHPHRLQPLDREPESLFSCQICNKPCSLGPTWSCESCNFHIHKPCLDFLPEIVEINHGSKVVSWVLQVCLGNYCLDCKTYKYSKFFFSNCGEVGDKYLCISCCLIRKQIDSSQVSNVIDHFFHPCPDFKLIFSPFSTCNACLLSHYPFFYHCKVCDFFLCFGCSQLPQFPSHENEDNQLVQHFCHSQPLKFFPSTIHTNKICNLCERFCSKSFYGCIDLCEFYVHKSCMDSLAHKTSHLSLNLPVVLLRVQSFECITCHRQCSGLAYYCHEHKYNICVKCTLWPENVLGEDGRFKSVLHWHQLSVCETKMEDKTRRCFLCKEHCIAWTLCYKCDECDLFFHKSCAELPAELEHPTHPLHRLTLTNRSSSLPNEALTCDLCLKRLSQNFVLYDLIYRCHQCEFHLDTLCASCLPSLEYKGHRHLLYVVVNMDGDTTCRECSKSCRGSCTIRCGDQQCDFSLHLHCGPLPRTVNHACHVHSFILKDYYVEDNGSDEFACHICEEKRDPRLRVYYCSEDCLMVCDIKCVLYQVLPLLRGERGHLELSTPFPQVACKVIKWEAGIGLDATAEGDGHWDQKIQHYFSHRDLSRPFRNRDWPNEYESDMGNDVGHYDLDQAAGRYSFSWNVLSYFNQRLRAVTFKGCDFLEQYDGSATTGAYGLPEILSPIYEEFFGKYNIYGHESSLDYDQMRLLVFTMCSVLHEMRKVKVVDVTLEAIRQWLGLVKFIERSGGFNVGIVAENFKQVWQAHYYIQSKKIVDEKTSRLERELEQVSMYKAELRTKIDELRIMMHEAEKTHQELKVMDKEHETYVILGSRGPMKKVRSDALEIKWRTCYEALVTRPGNMPPM